MDTAEIINKAFFFFLNKHFILNGYQCDDSCIVCVKTYDKQEQIVPTKPRSKSIVTANYENVPVKAIPSLLCRKHLKELHTFLINYFAFIAVQQIFHI